MAERAAMRLCLGTSKGIVVLDVERGAAPVAMSANPAEVCCLALSADGAVIFAGAGEAGGPSGGLGALARSVDRGRNWAEITPAATREAAVSALATPPDNPAELLLGNWHGRLFRSLDFGRDFHEVAALQLALHGERRHRRTNSATPVRAIAVDPLNPATIYVAVQGLGVFRSTNRGQQFAPINHGLERGLHALALDAQEPRRVYLTVDGGFYRLSTNLRWRPALKGLSRPYLMPLAVDRAGAIFTAGAAGPPPTWAGPYGADALLFVSRDHGLTFEPLAAAEGPLRAMVSYLLPHPSGEPILYALTTAGALLGIDSDSDTITELIAKLPPAYALAALP